MGKTNIDETGMRYGVISQHSIDGGALSDIYFGHHSVDLAYERWLDEIKSALHHALKDFLSSQSLEDAVETVLGMDSLGEGHEGEADPRYETDGYIIEKCLDADLIVMKSRFFTYAQYCSPCVPGACNLDSPLEMPTENGSNCCYCLGHDFFEDGKAPYKVYSMLSGEEIASE